ncbi:hypothetical protein D3C87_1877990 [compost metagenome]
MVGQGAVDQATGAKVDQLFGDGHADVTASRNAEQHGLLIHFLTQLEHQVVDLGNGAQVTGSNGRFDLIGEVTDGCQEGIELRHVKPLFE